MNDRFEIRYIHQDEAMEAAQVEATCFPPHEACTPEHMIARAAMAPDLFLVAIDKENGKMAGFLNGLATHEDKLRDEFFVDETLHDPKGKNILLLGLSVMPEYRRQGLATALMAAYAEAEKAKGRQNLILTCLDGKVAMYRKMGYTDLGMSASNWGGEAWHEMIMKL